VVKVISLDTATPHEIAKLVEEVPTSDLVVMVASAGADAQAAAIIGAACSLKRVMTTTLVVHAASATDDALSKTLAQVRPWSLMVVIASDAAYVEEILGSFR
jgi:phosphoribosylcarboxyaminoimidazole (NCAIR) mutase